MKKMRLNTMPTTTNSTFILTLALLLTTVGAEDPYRFFNWNITYGRIYPLGLPQQVPPTPTPLLSINF